MTLAIGVVAFGLVSMVGLLPAGLQVFRKAMDLTLETQMVQQIVGDAGQLEYKSLPDLESRDYYFDDTGTVVDSDSPLKLYEAKIQVDMDSKVPGDSNTANGNLALLTITFARAGVSGTGSQATQGKFVTYIADRAGQLASR
jgi:uncharacterized protein (TIGR02598 family)